MEIDIPSSVAAVATDAVKTSYHAIIRRAEVKPSETVFLFGLGGLGFNGLQVVLHIGARVIISDVRQERLDEAKKIGVPESDIVPVGASVQDFVRDNSLTGKIDTVLDFAGKHQTFQDAQAIGTLLLLIAAKQLLIDCRSPPWRQDGLHRHIGRYESHRYEDWYQEKTKHYIHIWRPEEGPPRRS